ncbi:MAG: DUF3088 family protein [Pseudoxanthomonas sp.]
MPTSASKPILFLLHPEFEDQALPGQRFFCKHSLLLEGALARIEGLRERLVVEHVDFSRPRHALIEHVGEQDQSLPKLLLPRGVRSRDADGEYAGRQYVSGSEHVLSTLNALWDIPVAHP